MSINRILKSIYTNIDNPASFSSPTILWKSGKKKLPKLKFGDVIKFLETSDVYTLHRSVRRKFPTRKTISRGLFHMYQCDLIDVSRLKSRNNNVCFLLVVICVFSRKLAIEPLRSKSAKHVHAGFEKIFRKMRKPMFLGSDSGTEFVNKLMQDYFKSKNIKHFTISSDTKASVAERVNRTVMSKMYKYFTHTKDLHYLNVLQRIVTSYNNTPHRSLPRLTPNEITKKNEKYVWEFQYGDYIRHNHPKFKFSIGDKVRISSLSRVFKKGYLPTMSTEIFTISDTIASKPPTYKLSDLNQVPISGIFYHNELQKVRK